jgi:hypothetical protein
MKYLFKHPKASENYEIPVFRSSEGIHNIFTGGPWELKQWKEDHETIPQFVFSAKILPADLEWHNSTVSVVWRDVESHILLQIPLMESFEIIQSMFDFPVSGGYEGNFYIRKRGRVYLAYLYRQEEL